MQPERDDLSTPGMTEEADPAMLVGALGDERTGLDQHADDAADAAGEAGPAAAPAALRSHRSSRGEPGSGGSPGDLAASSGVPDADPAMLVGALGDERVGLDAQRDAEEPTADPG
jgi:hypothetical protein